MGNGNAPGGGSAPGGGIIPGGGGGNIPGGGMWGTCGGAVEVAWYAAAVKERQINVRESNNKGAENYAYNTPGLSAYWWKANVLEKYIERGGTAVLSFYAKVAEIWHSKFKC